MGKVKITIYNHAASERDKKLEVCIDTADTIAVVKEGLVDILSVEAACQQLVYKGKVLKDADTFEQHGLKEGETVHFVPKKKKSEAAPTGTPQTTTPAPTRPEASSTPTQRIAPTAMPAFPNLFEPSASGGSNNPMGGLGQIPGLFRNSGLGGGLGGAGGMEDMRRQLMENPEMMQEIMNSPMFQSMLDNPNIMQNMVENNPQLQNIMNENPELRQVLSDPETMRQSMRMASNPELMREMMRNQDRALNNISSHPEGFNALRRMYTDVQEPLYEASINGAANRYGRTGVSPSVAQAQAEVAAQEAARQTSSGSASSPNNDPLPNPWGRPSAAPSTTATPGVGGMGNLFGSTGGGAGMSSVAGLMGQMGGNSSGQGAGAGMDMNAAMGMMQTPMMQQMLQQMTSDPNFVDNLERTNPMLRQMLASNPMARQMMRNPAVLRQMMDPATIRASMELQQAMRGIGNPPSGNGANPLAAMLGQLGQPSSNTGTGASNPWANLGEQGDGAATPATPSSHTSTAASPLNDWNAFAQAMNMSSDASGTSGQTPAERYATQLEALHGMGFTDDDANISALEASRGNVNGAVDRLLGGS